MHLLQSAQVYRLWWPLRLHCLTDSQSVCFSILVCSIFARRKMRFQEEFAFDLNTVYFFFKSDSNTISHTIENYKFNNLTYLNARSAQIDRTHVISTYLRVWEPPDVSSSKAWACRLCPNFPQQTLRKAWPCRAGQTRGKAWAGWLGARLASGLGKWAQASSVPIVSSWSRFQPPSALSSAASAVQQQVLHCATQSCLAGGQPPTHQRNHKSLSSSPTPVFNLVFMGFGDKLTKLAQL